MQILTQPLNAPISWEEAKSEEERAAMIKVLRETEIKWSKRCLYASLGFTLALAAVIVGAVLTTPH